MISNSRKPDFLCIGGQKCGTTWLHEMLSQHPKIFLPSQKELHYFDHRRNFQQVDGLDLYLKNFANCKDDQIIGEITPGYMWTAGVSEDYDFDSYRALTPQRVSLTLGSQIRILVLLRNPVWRAVSAYLHHVFLKRIGPDDSILDVGQNHGIFSIGFYSLQLEKWFDHFDRRLFYFGDFVEIQNNRSGVISSVLDFLGVNMKFVPKRMERKYQATLNYIVSNECVMIETGIKSGNFRQIVSKSEIGDLKNMYRNEILYMEDLLAQQEGM